MNLGAGDFAYSLYEIKDVIEEHCRINSHQNKNDLN
jgi:hypothetical protein